MAFPPSRRFRTGRNDHRCRFDLQPVAIGSFERPLKSSSEDRTTISVAFIDRNVLLLSQVFRATMERFRTSARIRPGAKPLILKSKSMADTTRENLYTAPESSGETSGDTMRSVVVQWTLWMGAAAVTASLLTVTWSVLRKPRIDNPEICVVLLIIFTIQISRRRSFLSAICLCQAVNMTVWLAMLIGLLLALPII